MTFLSNFTFDNVGAYANEKILFTAEHQTGLLQDSDDLEIDGHVQKSDLILSDYFISNISKIEWSFSDGYFYNSETVNHKFKESKTEYVKLKIWSDVFTYSGDIFYFTHSITKQVDVQSRFFKFLINKFPLYDEVKSPEFDDLVLSLSRFFDRMHKDVTDLYKLIDIEKLDPSFFEYWALTLGHEDYIRKIGYTLDKNDILNYDIYDRIKLGTATTDEILLFRKFLLYSVEIFRNKGTNDNISKFFSFFDIDCKVKELWTKTWNLVTKGTVSETFCLLDKFENNKMGLLWDNLNISNINNEKSNLIIKNNYIILDSYHNSDKINISTDSVASISGSEKDGWLEFELSNSLPSIINICNNNRSVAELITFSEKYDIVPNKPVRKNENSPTILQISPDILSEGDTISVIYDSPMEEKIECAVSSNIEPIKDFDIRLKFQLGEINHRSNLFSAPDNEIFVIFRGIKASNSNETDYDSFYKFNINVENSSFSLDKVIYNSGINDYLTQHISLNYIDDNIYESVILDESGNIFVFEQDKIYEILLVVSDIKVSAFIRENKRESELFNAMIQLKGSNNLGINEDTEWVNMLENFSLNVPQKQIKSVDIDGKEIYSEPYTIINESGHYGTGVKNGKIIIHSINLNNMDIDTSLYTDLEKELQIKPKYLENVERFDVRYDNYGDTQKQFIKTITKSFVPESLYPTTIEESSSLEKLFITNSPVSNDIGTRYTVSFKDSWVAENFSSDSDLINSIIIPFGSQLSWFIPENKIMEKENYSRYNSISGSCGYFSADQLTILGKYDTEPFDSFSELSRAKYSTDLYISSKLVNYIEYNKSDFEIKGIWEEVYPHSNKFESIDADIVLDDLSVFKNKMFSPLTVDIPEGKRVIGVQFNNCSYIDQLISRYSTEFNKEVVLYGSFKFHIPCNTVKYKPSNNNLKQSSLFPNDYEIDVFIPLGILNKEITIYSLGNEFIKQSNNIPSLITLNGLFANLSTYNFDITQNKITLNTPNPFESLETGMSVSYFISASLNLATTLEENPNSATERNTDFIISKNIRSFLSDMSDTQSHTIEELNWWLPKTVWRKRIFEQLEADLSEDILSGINFTDKSIEKDNSPKIFFGKDIDTNHNKVNSLRLKLKDGKVTPGSMYYAKVKIKIDYSGFDNKTFDMLNEIDRENLKVNNKSNSNSVFKTAPIKLCKEIYIPLSWYAYDELVTTNTDYDKCSTDKNKNTPTILNDTIQYANFIERSFSGQESFSFTPLGQMTEALNYKQNTNINVLLNTTQLAKYIKETPEWSIVDWNKYFLDHLEILEIYEEINPENYKLYNKYTILSENYLNIGSNINIEYNNNVLDWDIIENTNLAVTKITNTNYYFEIPHILKDMEFWVNNVRRITLNDYLVPEESYVINKTSILFKNSSFLNKLVGSSVYGVFDFDLYFDKSKTYKEKHDDFRLNRDINWIPYEANSNEIYENLSRLPSTDMLLGETSPNQQFYDIISVDNINCFKSLNRNSLFPFEGRQSGSRKSSKTINVKQNEPNARRLYVIDNDNYIFDISADVFFDSKLNDIKNYKGKKFEVILKSSEIFDYKNKKNVLNSYYFAGIGSFDFDIALGVSAFNHNTSNTNTSFLAGFGDYNTKNIKFDTWYTIRCVVTDDYIRVLFNEKNNPEKLVLNYFINKDYQTDPSRYLGGNFEELVYNIAGLGNMNITYPDKAGEITDTNFVRNNINSDLISSTRPFGSLCGFRIFNEYTYMTNIKYKYLSEDGIKIGNPFQGTDLTEMIIDISKTNGN
jgi:hypothetical protein